MAAPGLIRSSSVSSGAASIFRAASYSICLFLLIVALCCSRGSRRTDHHGCAGYGAGGQYQGDVVEEYSVGARKRLLPRRWARPVRNRLRDVLAVLDAAARDPQISRVVPVLRRDGQCRTGDIARTGRGGRACARAGKPSLPGPSRIRRDSISSRRTRRGVHASVGCAADPRPGRHAWLLQGPARTSSASRSIRSRPAATRVSASRSRGPVRRPRHRKRTPTCTTVCGRLAGGRRAGAQLTAGSVMAAINDLRSGCKPPKATWHNWCSGRSLVDGLKRRDEFPRDGARTRRPAQR